MRSLVRKIRRCVFFHWNSFVFGISILPYRQRSQANRLAHIDLFVHLPFIEIRIPVWTRKGISVE